MPFILWEDKYALGDPLVDAHHKVFFDIINQFYDLTQKGTADASLADLVTFMVDYAHMHFGAEERLMRKANYPDFEVHKASHDMFGQFANRLMEKLRRTPSAVPVDEVFPVLRDWLTNHILVMDKQIETYLVGREEEMA